MAKVVSDRVLDNGLVSLRAEATHIILVSADPSTYSEAATTFALGNKNFGAGGCFDAPADGTPNGRKLDSIVITDGDVTDSGTASGWAVVDAINSRLLANGELDAPVVLVSGNTFELESFAISLPGEPA